MSKRSKHGRGKHPHFRKKSKFKYMQPGAGVMQAGAGVMPASPGVMPPATGDMSRMAAPTVAAPTVAAPPLPQAPPQKKLVPSAALPIHYEFIGGDLKRIGILTAVIVVILIVLFMFLK